MNDLEKLCDEVLAAGLRDELRSTIEAMRDKGVSDAAIARHVKKLCGGKRTSVVLAVEAYLNRPQEGNP